MNEQNPEPICTKCKNMRLAFEIMALLALGIYFGWLLYRSL